MQAAIHVATTVDDNRLEETRDRTRCCNRVGEVCFWRAGLAKYNSLSGRIVGRDDPAVRMR